MLTTITPEAILDRACEILTTKNWIRGSFARDEFDQARDPGDPAACSFCAVGAVEAAVCQLAGVSKFMEVVNDNREAAYQAEFRLDRIVQERNLKTDHGDVRSVIGFNDGVAQGKDEVIGVFKEAGASC